MKKWLAISLLAATVALPVRTEAAINITDVPASSSHYDAVSYLNNQHAFDYMGSHFNANGYATRAQVAEVLYRAYANKLAPIRTYKGFSDVTTNTPHYEAIKWSYEVGIFDGSGNYYHAGNNIRRDQLAKVLVSAFQLQKAPSSIAFRDVGNDSFTESIYTLASLGITTGDNGYFKPRQFVTNSQLASFIYRLQTGKTVKVATSYNSEYSFSWQVASTGANLRFKGMDGTAQVAQYTAAKGDNIGGVVIGSSTKRSVDSVFPNKVTSILRNNTQYNFPQGNEYTVLEVNNQYVYVFYDIHANYTVRALLAVNKQYEVQKNGFYGTQSADSLKHYDALMYEMINQARLAKNVSALHVSKANETVAYNHSKDMYSNRYFGHTNLYGQTPMGRYMQQGNGNFYSVGENIAQGQFNAIFAFEELHNSMGHRQNLLNASWTHMAVGSYAGSSTDMQNGSTPYFTQMFFK